MGSNKIKLKLIILFIFIFILFIIFCIFYYINNKKETVTYLDKSNNNSYIDPGSGETVSSPSGKTKEKTDTTNTITFLGFTTLLDHGLSYKQLNKLKSYFNQYSLTQKTPINEISITTASYNSPKTTDNRVMNFEITINRKNKLDTKVKINDIDSIILYLYDKTTQKQVYKSYNN